MPKTRTIVGSNQGDLLSGRAGNEVISGRAGDDLVFGRGGNDTIRGERGFDTLFGDDGDDWLWGGQQNDSLQGGAGNDVLHGDSGRVTLKGADFGSDNLNGGAGRDILHQSDGNDTMTGGHGRDTFQFKWQDPMIALAAGTGRAFTTITDFNPDQDRFVFDVAGLGRDAEGANFVDGGNGTVGGYASSFFQGDAADTDGEAVMVLTDTGFATGVDAVAAAQGEETGDFILYFNTTVNVASLLFVDGTDEAHSIARFASLDSLDKLADAGFQASDFLFG